MTLSLPQQHQQNLAELLSAIATTCVTIAQYTALSQNNSVSSELYQNAMRQFLTVITKSKPFMVSQLTQGASIQSCAVRAVRDFSDVLAILQSQLPSPAPNGSTAKNTRTQWLYQEAFASEGFLKTVRNGDNWHPITERIGEHAMRILLPYIVDEFKQAIRDAVLLQDGVPDSHNAAAIVADPEAAICDSMRAITGNLECPEVKIPDQLEFATTAEVACSIRELAEEYGESATASRDVLVTNGRMLAVTDWSGETRYPKFQFRPHVPTVLYRTLPNVPAFENPWAIALFFRTSIQGQKLFTDDDVSECVEIIRWRLGFVNQWKPSIVAFPTNPAEGSHEMINNDIRTAATRITRLPSKLFRVAKLTYTPFHHQCVTPNIPKESKDYLQAGRLTPSLSYVGACYYAGASDASWAEAMAQHVTLCLDDILGRLLFQFKIKPLNGQELADMWLTNLSDTQLVGRSISKGRAVTRDLADRLIETYPGRIGVQYRLTKPDDCDSGNSRTHNIHGYAIWGPPGEANPVGLRADHAYDTEGDGPSRGKWDAGRGGTPALDDSSGFAEYLTQRLTQKEQPYPVALWRFPTQASTLDTATQGQGDQAVADEGAEMRRERYSS